MNPHRTLPFMRQRTLPAMLRRQAEAFGDAPFLAVGEARWTHAEPAQAAERLARALVEAGIGAGERVALMCGNRIEFIEVFLGCGWLGATAVPINTASMGPQIGYFLADSAARLLVIEARFLARLDAAAVGRTRVESIWVVSEAGDDAAPDDIGGLPIVAYPVGGGTSQAWPELADPLRSSDPSAVKAGVPAAVKAGVPAAVESGDPAVLPHESAEQPPEPAVQPGDPLAILYTSGTTGPAKGVICPHAQFFWWGRNSAEVLGVHSGDVLCSTLPLFHINALNTFAQAALTGCRVVFETRFSASNFWPAMQACEATVVYLLGAMVPILLARPVEALERGHRVRIGLGPGVPPTAADAFRARTGVALIDGYGSTETNFVIATAPESPRKGVMGWLRPGFDARVADADDAELPPGQAGELLLRADEPYAFAAGYHGMPQQTVEAWRNLWFHTGDRVVRDADGAFRFIDRIKDAIRRRGENISSFEVEQVLLSHSAVAAAAVYPVASDLAEDEVMAALTVRVGQRLDPAELTAFCENRLPRFAVPRYVEVLADLPRTENGKVQKYKLRERGVTAATWDRQASEGSAAQYSHPTGGEP